MKLTVYFVAFLLSLNFLFAEDTNIRTISVSGNSEITVEAETAIINTSVRVVDDDMDQSYRKLEEIIKNVVNDLYGIGIKDTDIDRSIITQGKENEYYNGKYKFKGYFAQSMMKVKLIDIKNLSKLYKILAKYEAILTQNVSFERSDIFELKLKEYEKAIKYAKIKAETMVKTLGSNLGKVKTIDSDTYAYPTNYRSMDKLSMNSSTESISVANVGFITISAQVSLVFYIEE